MYIAVIGKQDKTHFNLTLSTEHHGGSTHHRNESPTRAAHGAPRSTP